MAEGDILDTEPVDEAGAGDTSWREQLTESVRSDPTIAQTKDIESMATQLINAQKQIGGSIRKPADDATVEEWGSFHQKLGRPESIDGYTYKPGDEVPEQFRMNEDQRENVLTTMHAAGMTDRQVSEILSWDTKVKIDAHNQFAEKSRLGLEELRTTWGGEYDNNVQVANRALNSFGGEDVKELLGELGIQNNPQVIKMFERIGSVMGEDNLVMGDNAESPALASEVDALINETQLKMMSMTSDDPEYQILMGEKEKLYERRYGTAVESVVG
tara:strand:+ start:412 stop:1227 length:816 start_codon:yes stop_codon:yes gene_type:complete